MGREADRFSAGGMDKTIYVRSPDFTTDLQLDFESFNVTSGILIGLGPRYAGATIPGQADNETISGTREPGLRAAEGTPAQGLRERLKVLACVPISIGTVAAPETKINAYVWVMTINPSSVERLAVQVATTTTETSANIYDGFGPSASSLNNTSNYDYLLFEAIPAVNADRTTPVNNALAYTSGKFYASTAVITSSGQNVPMRWYVGQALTSGDATHAPDIACWKCTTLETNAATPGTIEMGVPSQFNLQNYTTGGRPLNIFTFDANGDFNCQYSLTVAPSSSTFKRDVAGAKTVNLDIDGLTATRLVAGVPASTVAALVEDGLNFQLSSYSAVLVASKKAFATIFQDAYSTETSAGSPIHRQQLVDLTQLSWEPPTIAPTSATSTYVEDTRDKSCPFYFWPAFIRGTAMTNFGGVTSAVTLGGANTGVLRANTVYEFTYSVFNKRLATETNVNPNPVKFQVGATDFCSLKLFDTAGAPGGHTTIFAYWGQLQLTFMPFVFSNNQVPPGGTSSYFGSKEFLNFFEYRFYYRQEGTFEWIPALVIDAAKFWFFPHNILAACTGAISSLPGGQPGAFNDYSPLPKDTYDCVVSYKDRAWWFSEKAINFSLRDNIFAYPARNSINAASGTFRGGIVHNYPGQAEQSSRLVIFGSDTTYVARFSGLPQQTQVQVSANTSATFNIDGSDLVIDPWTSATAFSYRSAVVADGILFWWGPEGIFRDDGVATPTKISTNMIEPDLFTLYYPAAIDQIHASYNSATKEITWCYPPNVSGGYATHALVYNVENQSFLRTKYVGQIDWISNLNIQTGIDTGGKRSIAGVRNDPNASIQRAYFYDQNNRAGDMRPTTDFVVKQISTPSTGLRRLTLAAGYDATNFATLAVGDLIAMQQTTRYAASISPASDMVAEIAALGAGTIDITLPADASLDTGSLTFNEYFPIWHKTPSGNGLNGFPWQIKTGYWMPEGVVGYFLWLYCYTMYGVNIWASDVPLSYSFAYRSPTSTGYQTDTITLTDNSDGTCQVYHPLTIGNDAMEGQAIKLLLSGTHIGHQWLLQYLEQYARPIDGDPLLRFEG